MIPNGVDLVAHRPVDQWENASVRLRLGLDDGPLVVCAGRLSRQKGQDVLLEAWPLVEEKVPGARLVLVGSGPDKDSIVRRAVGRVAAVGERADAAEWIGAADVVAMPSRWEGMSFVMLEAMARGRCIVATDVSGASECLDGAGAVVPVENPRALADAIAERLRDRALREAEGREARLRAERSYDLARTTRRIAELYLEMLHLRWPEEIDSISQ